MKKLQFCLLLCAGISVSLNSISSDDTVVKNIRLANGLTVWLNEDHSQPRVFGAVVVRAGARDCPNTGIAHYFEHMMFKGTQRIGTTNYPAEKVYLDSIAACYDRLASTKEESQRSSIQQHINALSIKASQFAIPNEFDRLIARYGGSGLNASTSWDYTQYFNDFTPRFLRQWAEINSERLIHPVFRMFQSELETVYEEKNMSEDRLGGQAIDKVFERFFAPHPYAYPIIGSTENLKNPRLSEMKAFFEKYYVAGNMGLLLCGDFNAEEVVPVLEETFGRIRPGVVNEPAPVMPTPFKGRETFEVKLAVPLVKPLALCWRSVPAGHPDLPALTLIKGLLNNSNSTGLLDKLSADGKLLIAMNFPFNQKDAGLTGLIIVPKIIGQSPAKAKALVTNELDKIKKGDFSDDVLKSLKLEMLRERELELENTDSRAGQMLELLGTGRSWNSYLNENEAIRNLQKADIVRVANQYYTDNYLEIKKTMGDYPKNKLKKPDFKPVAPANKDVISAYADSLKQFPDVSFNPRFLDFKNDVTCIKPTSGLCTFYGVKNNKNDVFSLKMKFARGTVRSKRIEALGQYLSLVGCDTLSFHDFRNQLQTLGSSLQVSADKTDFSVELKGFNAAYEPSVVLLARLLQHPGTNKEALKQVFDAAKVNDKSFRKSNDMMDQALFEKAAFGNASDFLNTLSLKQTLKLKDSDLRQELDSVLHTECTVHYCGDLTAEQASSVLWKFLPADSIITPALPARYRTIEAKNENTVYILNFPKASQNIVRCFVKGGVNASDYERLQGKLFSMYFGEDMSSLVFQEIREFRSLAYRSHARYISPDYQNRSREGLLVSLLSTQTDKTVEAMQVLDSLMHKMPLVESRVESARSGLINDAVNQYPDMRSKSENIATYLEDGYTGDPNRFIVSGAPSTGLTDIAAFYEKNIKGKALQWTIVGDVKKMDLKKLAVFGKIVVVPVKSIRN